MNETHMYYKRAMKWCMLKRTSDMCQRIGRVPIPFS